jgi:hypothetical protein
VGSPIPIAGIATTAFGHCRLIGPSACVHKKLPNAHSTPLTKIAIEKYRQTRAATLSRHKKALAPGSVNRELATLRRLLRLAYEWNVIDRVPRIKLLRGENSREFTLPHDREAVYIAALPDPLKPTTLLLDTSLWRGEALSLDWAQVRLDPVKVAQYGYLIVDQ